LINDLLSFTRLSVPATFEEQSLEQILHEVMSDLELLIKEKEAQFSIDPLPDAEVVKSHIRQVFQNIISNAMKFSRPGINPHIRIRCERVATLAFVGGNDPSGPYCRISIQDNGIGFDNAYAEKIFTIFQRLHSKEQYDGTGIGLAITRKIIEKHGGIITAYSEAGEGATFSLVIPLEQRKEEQKEDKRIVDNIAQ
jgi:two-component system CheB/CheR fusion protein